MHFNSRKHVEKIDECYHIMFGSEPKKIHMLPLEKGDHPELDASKYLCQDGIKNISLLLELSNGLCLWVG